MAEQTQPVRRKVALKIIKLGMDTKEVIARFEQERQALALMDHPHIAKVFDAGATPSGRPYFVMELVRGIPITQFCDERQMSTRQRIELFIQVCGAVQHAHQKGIIHRDLKPSNILVCEQDGAPMPKVIDFGIAKAMAERLTEHTLFTRFEQMIGTPSYMSPEQAVSDLDIDTRSDIYSLGVLLYELLAGCPPFDLTEAIKRGVDEIRRTIREREPQRPSTAVSGMMRETLTSVAQARSSEAPRLASQLRGDLDWIVMKCLEKDRRRRYPSASTLAEDLQRHLDSEPVQARPPSTGYRMGRLIRRHKLPFAAGLAVFLSLVAGLAVSLMLLVERDKALQNIALLNIREALAVGDDTRIDEALAQAHKVGVDAFMCGLLHAQQQMLRGEMVLAARVLEPLVQQHPDNVSARALLATAQVMDWEWGGYEAQMAVLQGLRPQTREDHLFLGQALAQSDPRQGIKLIQHALALHPTSMGYVLLADAQTTQAIQTGSMADINAAVGSIESAHHLTKTGIGVLAISTWTHAVGAGIAHQAGDAARMREWLDVAARDGLMLEAYLPNPLAISYRAQQLDIGHQLSSKPGGPNPADAFLDRLWWSHPHASYVRLYAESLLRRGRIKEALAIIDQHPDAGDTLDACRLLARVEAGQGVLPVLAQESSPSDGGRRSAVNALFSAPACLLLMGQSEQATAAAVAFLGNPPASFATLKEHYHRVAAFLAGRVSEESLLAASQSSQWDLCEAHAQAAMKRLARGDRDGTRRHLQQVLETQAWRSIWFSAARIMLARLDADPAWPRWIPVPHSGDKID